MKQLYQNLTGKKLLFRMKMHAPLQAMKYLLILIGVTAFFLFCFIEWIHGLRKTEYWLALVTVPA